MTFLSELRSLDEGDQFLVLERAAIIEFCGNVPQVKAERLAMADFARMCGARGGGDELSEVRRGRGENVGQQTAATGRQVLGLRKAG